MMNIVRSMAKHLPHPLLSRLYHHVRVREESVRIAKVSALTGLPLLETLNLSNLRKSDTLFILGSAWSINNIPAERWQIIGRHDSIGINFWPAHPFVPRFFHFENMTYDEHPAMYCALLNLFKRRAEAYANTIKIVTEVVAIGQRQMVFELPDRMRRNLYLGFSIPVVARNEEELRTGVRYMRSQGAFGPRTRIQWLFKYGGSLTAMLALAVLMGYRRVILCGVDLNKQNYFYQDPELYPEYANWEFVSRTEVHRTARRLPWLMPSQSAVHIFKELVLQPANIELFVESPDSTLYPQVSLAAQTLFDELAKQTPMPRRVSHHAEAWW
jgi:hypothetical protein